MRDYSICKPLAVWLLHDRFNYFFLLLKIQLWLPTEFKMPCNRKSCIAQHSLPPGLMLYCPLIHEPGNSHRALGDTPQSYRNPSWLCLPGPICPLPGMLFPIRVTQPYLSRHRSDVNSYKKPSLPTVPKTCHPTRAPSMQYGGTL